MSDVPAEVSKYMGKLGKKSWEQTRSKKQNMKELGALGGKAGKGKTKKRKKLNETASS